MTFFEALEYVKKGQAVILPEWRGSGLKFGICPPDEPDWPEPRAGIYSKGKRHVKEILFSIKEFYRTDWEVAEE